MRAEKARAAVAGAFAAILLAASGCGDREQPRIAPGRIVRADGRPERSLLALVPPQARAGEIFQRQPDGRAALAVLGTGLTPGDVIHFAGRALPTAAANSRLLTAAIPPELLARAGDVEVTVSNPNDPSQRALHATFRILAAAP
ncbi:MAG TPA: hypothetical protein VIA45_09315 [Thermoanaerobaculia bacterium]|jgi:hypothetical protein